MLFAVIGGGFFSSSASGYSNGLTLLLLGRRNEERPMRVSPWNQYQLVEEEADPGIQLASRKNRVSCGCAASICFGRASVGLDGPSPPKVGPVHQSDSLSDTASVSENNKICTTNDAGDENGRMVCLKSSLKKKTPTDSAVVVGGDRGTCETLDDAESNVTGCTERRKVQWTDTCGKELVKIREFELSDESSSDEEFERQGDKRCECVVQ